MASCRRGDEERNVLEEARRGVDKEDVNGWRKARIEGARILEVMVEKGCGERLSGDWVLCVFGGGDAGVGGVEREWGCVR